MIMKLKLFLAFTILNAVFVFAQEKGNFELGGNMGVNISNIAISGVDVDETNSKTGLNLAVSGEYYFNDRWGLKAKLIYDQKGWADSFVEVPFDNDPAVIQIIEGDMELNYLSIPVMANWHFGKKRNWYLNFGLYTAFLLSAEVAGIDTKEGFENSDFGLALGIGVKFPISDKAKLFLEYDAQSGFSNIFKDSGSISARNGRSAFNFGVLFSL